MTYRPRAAYVAPDTTQIEINGQNWVNEAALQHAFGYVLEHSDLDVQLEYQVGHRYQRIDLLVSSDATQWLIEAKRKLTMETSYTIVGQIRSYKEHFPDAICFGLVGEIESEAAIETLRREEISLIVFTPANFGENMQAINHSGRMGASLARTFIDPRQPAVPAFNQQFTTRRVQPRSQDFSVFSVSDGFGPTRRFTSPQDTRFSSNAPVTPIESIPELQPPGYQPRPTSKGITTPVALAIAGATTAILAVVVLVVQM